MRKLKNTLFVTICMLFVVTLLASCGKTEEPTTTTTEPSETQTTAPTTGTETTPVTTPTSEKEMVKDIFGNLVEKPEYGGWLTIVTNESGGLDPLIYQNDDRTGRDLVFELLCLVDWTRGPLGTGEHAYNGYADPQFYVGGIAESWDIPDPNTLIFHIRKGVHWQNRPPVNGRELVADDVVYSLIRHNNAPLGAYPTPPNEVYAEDKYTVVLKLEKPDPVALWTINNQYYIAPPEVTDYSSYKNVIGTGPYILTDFVSGNAATLERNPDYWRHDELLPEYQLPYIDGITQLCITDQSVALAALRTNKVDILYNVQWQQVESLKTTNPHLKKFLAPGNNCMILSLKEDIEPYNDIRVRRALSMAIDREAILEGYWGGAAEIFNWPIQASSTGCYTPLEEMPDEVQENYSYNPEKAKQLLSEAGITDLTVKTMVLTTPAYYQEVMSLVLDYWSDIGVNGEIEVLEGGPFWNNVRSWNYETVYTLFGNSNPFSGAIRYYDPALWLDWCRVDDPFINDIRNQLLTTTDLSGRNELMREAAVYETSQAWVVELPKPGTYIFWQPWLKRYEGWYGQFFRYYETHPYFWIDQDLKNSIIGK
jgi:peptide/nickel transport system substrate-binding protein